MVRDSANLQALRQSMLDVLTRLDQSGHPLAAAHLASAIDALDEDVAASARSPQTPARRYADALRLELGDRAEDVVRQQIKLAQGDILRVWSKILAHLQEPTVS